MEVKILGTGCSKCEKLERNLKKVIEELGIEVRVESVDDLVELVSYGVMQTPGFVVNDEVKSVGKALSKKEIKKFLEE